MTTYFGFIPSQELDQQLDDLIDIVNNQPEEELYPHQLSITNKIAHEIIDNIFNKLIDIVQDPKRKAKMQKVVNTINTSIDGLLKHILSPQPNHKVMDAFDFLFNDCLFNDDNSGESIRKIGFLMDASKADTLITNFSKAKKIDAPHDLLIEAMDIIIEEVLQHYIKDFSTHLHLGMLKRKAVPIAEVTINKASKIATHKLLPEMDNDACHRLIIHFEKFLVSKTHSL